MSSTYPPSVSNGRALQRSGGAMRAPRVQQQAPNRSSFPLDFSNMWVTAPAISRSAAFAMGDLYTTVLDDIPHHEADLPPPPRSSSFVHGSIRGSLSYLTTIQRSVEARLRENALEAEARGLSEVQPVPGPAPPQTAVAVSGGPGNVEQEQEHQVSHPNYFTGWTHQDIAAQMPPVFTPPDITWPSNSEVEAARQPSFAPVGYGTAVTVTEPGTAEARYAEEQNSNEDGAFTQSLVLPHGTATVATLAVQDSIHRRNLSREARNRSRAEYAESRARQYPFQTRSAHEAIDTSSHPILSSFHSRRTAATRPARPLHLSSHRSGRSRTARGAGRSTIGRRNHSLAAVLTPSLLQHHARNTIINPTGRPWYDLTYIGELIQHLNGTPPARTTALIAQLQDRVAGHARVEEIVSYLALCNNFSDSRAVLDAETAREESLQAQTAGLGESTPRAWVTTENIRSPTELRAMSEGLRRREEFGVEMGFRDELVGSMGRDLGAWCFQAWCNSTGGEDGEDDIDETGWIDAQGRKTNGGEGCLRWIEGGDRIRGCFEAWGVGVIARV